MCFWYISGVSWVWFFHQNLDGKPRFPCPKKGEYDTFRFTFISFYFILFCFINMWFYSNLKLCYCSFSSSFLVKYKILFFWYCFVREYESLWYTNMLFILVSCLLWYSCHHLHKGFMNMCFSLCHFTTSNHFSIFIRVWVLWKYDQ